MGKNCLFEHVMLWFCSVEAQEFEVDKDVAPELLALGNPWIEANFLTWGQPLSLADDIAALLPKALVGNFMSESKRRCKQQMHYTVAIIKIVTNIVIIFL